MKSSANIIEAKLASAADLIMTRYDAFVQDPNDPETNHKLRVSIRTLRSLIDFVGPWQKARQNAQIQKSLKRVVRRTSRLRELDVLCAMVEESGIASEELIAFCRDKAARERDDVLAALTSKKLSRLLKGAVKNTRKINWKKKVAKRGLRAKAVRARYDALVDSLRADLAVLDENDYETVHDVRKRAKQVRYVSEQFEGILGADAVAEAMRMKDEQDRLGAICDNRVNHEIVQAFIEQEGLTPTLAEELTRIVA